MCFFLDPDDVAHKIQLNATVDNLLEKYGVPRKDNKQTEKATAEVAAEVANPTPPPPVPAPKPGRKAGKQAAMAKGASKGVPGYGRTRSAH